jgi:hypothetical protein
MQWTRQLVKLGIVTRVKNGGPGVRHGKNIHEMRDVWRSLWSKSSADHRVAEYIMGHVVDPLGYDKSFDDEGWTRKEYLKALPMLQLMSSGRPYGQIAEDELESLREEVTRLRAGKDTEVEALETRVKDLEAQRGRERNVVSAEKEDISALMKTMMARIEKLEKKGSEST